MGLILGLGGGVDLAGSGPKPRGCGKRGRPLSGGELGGSTTLGRGINSRGVAPVLGKGVVLAGGWLLSWGGKRCWHTSVLILAGRGRAYIHTWLVKSLVPNLGGGWP